MMPRFRDIISTTWLLMVVTSGSALDGGDGDGNDMRESASGTLTKVSPQSQPSLLPGVIVETSSTFIPDDIQKSSVFHLVQPTSSHSSDDVSGLGTALSSEVSPTVLISTTGESSSLHLIKFSSSPDYSTETSSLHIDHLHSSPPRLTDDMTSSVTSGKSTDETVTNPALSPPPPPTPPPPKTTTLPPTPPSPSPSPPPPPPPPPPPEESQSSAASIQTTLVPRQISIIYPSGFVLDDSDFIPELSNITAIIMGTLSQKAPSNITRTLFMDESSLERFVAESISRIASVWNYSLSDVEVTAVINNERDKISMKIFVECYCKVNDLKCEEANLLLGEMEAEIRRILHEYLRPLELNLKSFSAVEISGFNETCDSLKERLSCTWLIYPANQIEAKYDDVIVLPTGQKYASGMFQIIDDVITVCEKGKEVDMNSNTYAKQTLFEHEIMYPISIACLSISVLALTVRISLQFLITGIRNRPNRLQFQLSIAMLASFVGMLFTPMLADLLKACTVLSVCLLYFFTAALSWMTVIAVDTWMVFRPSAAFLRPDEEGTSLVVHYLCGWGIPVLVPMMTITANYLNINEHFKPKLGGTYCLYEDEFSMLSFLGIPVVILTLISILFYVLTAVNLKNALGKTAKTIEYSR